MDVTLTPALEAFIEERFATGLYDTRSEIVREALRLLQAHGAALAHGLASLPERAAATAPRRVTVQPAQPAQAAPASTTATVRPAVVRVQQVPPEAQAPADSDTAQTKPVRPRVTATVVRNGRAPEPVAVRVGPAAGDETPPQPLAPQPLAPQPVAFDITAAAELVPSAPPAPLAPAVVMAPPQPAAAPVTSAPPPPEPQTPAQYRPPARVLEPRVVLTPEGGAQRTAPRSVADIVNTISQRIEQERR